MKWTKTKPVSTGVYWWCQNKKKRRYLIRVAKNSFGFLVGENLYTFWESFQPDDTAFNSLFGVEIDTVNGYWSSEPVQRPSW